MVGWKVRRKWWDGRWGIRWLWGSKGWCKGKSYVVGRYNEIKINSEEGGERCLVKVGTYNVKCAERYKGVMRCIWVKCDIMEEARRDEMYI